MLSQSNSGHGTTNKLVMRANMRLAKRQPSEQESGISNQRMMHLTERVRYLTLSALAHNDKITGGEVADADEI